MRYLLLPLLVVVLDTICIISAAFFSIYIRFEDTAIAQKYLEMLISQLPIAVAVHLVVYFVFKLYGRVWRYAGSIELVAIVAANIVAALSWYGISIYIDLALPRSLYIFTASILVLFVGGSRLFFRIYSCFINKSKHKFISSKKDKVLIVGAGDAGALLLRELNQYHIGKRQVIGFIDDDKTKIGKYMVGTKVLGSRDDIAVLADNYEIDEIIIAMPSVKGKNIKEIINICKKIRPDVDFRNITTLVTDGFIDSFDIVSIIASIEDEFAVEIPVDSMVAENFESAAAIMNLVNGVKK